jgi:hypothetical protein
MSFLASWRTARRWSALVPRKLGLDDVQPLTDVLSNPMQRARAARASMVLDIDHHLDARQMRWQRAAVSNPARLVLR